MALESSAGVNPTGLKNIDRVLQDLLKGLTDGSRKSKESTEKLGGALDLLKKRSMDLKKTEDLLAASLEKVDKRSTEYKMGLESAAAIMAKSSGIMVDSEMALYKTRLDSAKNQEGMARRAGASVNTIAAFTARRQAIEQEGREAGLKSAVAVSKANHELFGGMINNIRLRGSQAATIAGNVMGVAPEMMGQVALLFGGFTLAIAGIASVISRISTSSLGASKSGFELTDSFGKMRGVGGQLAIEIGRQTGLMMPEAKAYELLGQARNEFAMGMVNEAKGAMTYTALIKADGDTRNAARMSVVGFVMDLAKLSGVFGMSQDEAVKLGTKIGVMTKGGFQSAERGFFTLAAQANILGIPLSNLVDTMGAMASQSDYMGQATMRTIAETISITDAIRDLGDAGAKGFKNIDAEKMNRITQQMVNFITSMSSNRVMALNMRPGGTFEQALGSVEMGGLKVKTDALNAALRMTGINRTGNITSTQALQFGLTAGFKGDSAEVTREGRQLAEIMRSGRLSPDQITKRMNQMNADNTDDKINTSKTVGQMLATGADPLAVIATILQKILTIAVDIGSSAVFTGSNDSARKMQAERSSLAPQAAAFSSAMSSRRSVYGRARM